MLNKIVFALFMVVTMGCGSKDVSQYADWQPELNLFEYFKGTTVASGVFFGRGGSVKTSFQLTLEGQLKTADQMVLKETLLYRNGEKVEREFQITRVAPDSYLVSCPDFVGQGTISTSGNAANWKYKMRQDIGGRVVTLKFDDWMYLQPDGTILNRAYAFWYGVGVGEVFMSARKV